MGSPAPSFNERAVRGLVSRVLAAPGGREFVVSRTQATTLYGFDSALLETLLAAGIPHVDDVTETYFAAPVLHFIGMHLGVARAHLTAARLWLRTLQRLSGARTAAFSIEYVLQTGRLPEGARTSVLRPDGRRVIARAVGGSLVFSGQITTSGDWPALPPSVASIVEHVARYDLYLRGIDRPADIEIAKRANMADCRTATALFINECVRAGIAARPAYGLRLSEPFSLLHVWPEVLVDGKWVPVDPLILGVHRRFSDLSESPEQSRQSPGVVLCRVAEEYEPLVTVGGAPIQITVLTTLHDVMS